MPFKYNLVIGNSFSNPTQSYTQINYDFVPNSVDKQKNGLLEINNKKGADIQVTVKLPGTDGEDKEYMQHASVKYNQEITKQCVLVVNQDATGGPTLTLERVSQIVAVRKSRNQTGSKRSNVLSNAALPQSFSKRSNTPIASKKPKIQPVIHQPLNTDKIKTNSSQNLQSSNMRTTINNPINNSTNHSVNNPINNYVNNSVNNSINNSVNNSINNSMNLNVKHSIQNQLPKSGTINGKESSSSSSSGSSGSSGSSSSSSGSSSSDSEGEDNGNNVVQPTQGSLQSFVQNNKNPYTAPITNQFASFYNAKPQVAESLQDDLKMSGTSTESESD